MGYESKIYIVIKHPEVYSDDHKKILGEVLAMYNVGKCPSFREIFTKPSECYIFLDGSRDKRTHEDDYGEPLLEADIDTVIGGLKDISDYELPLQPLLAMLIEYKNTPLKTLAVLHYGH